MPGEEGILRLQTQLEQLQWPVVETKCLSVVDGLRRTECVGDRGGNSDGVVRDLRCHGGILGVDAGADRAEPGHQYYPGARIVRTVAIGQEFNVPVDVGPILAGVRSDGRRSRHGVVVVERECARLHAQHVIGARDTRVDEIGEVSAVGQGAEPRVDGEHPRSAAAHGPTQREEETVEVVSRDVVMSWPGNRGYAIGVYEGRSPRDSIEGPLEAGLGVIRPGDEAVMRKNNAIAIGQFGNNRTEREAGSHPVDVSPIVTERLANDPWPISMIGECADCIRMDVIDVGEWKKGVHERLDGRANRPAIQQGHGEVLGHLLVGHLASTMKGQ